MSVLSRSIATLAAAALLSAAGGQAMAQKKYGPGASDTEIKIGNTVPYSGPASAYGILGKAYAAYFKKINDEGGINGRKINFISYDDAYSPPKTVEQTRRLVEQDEVLAIVGTIGTVVSCVNRPCVSRTTDTMFETVMGGSPSVGAHSSPTVSSGRGLVRNQKRIVGNAPLDSESDLVYRRLLSLAVGNAQLAALEITDGLDLARHAQPWQGHALRHPRWRLLGRRCPSTRRSRPRR